MKTHILTTGIELEDLRELGLTPQIKGQTTKYFTVEISKGKAILYSRVYTYIDDLEQFCAELEQAKQSIKEINALLK